MRRRGIRVVGVAVISASLLGIYLLAWRGGGSGGGSGDVLVFRIGVPGGLLGDLNDDTAQDAVYHLRFHDITSRLEYAPGTASLWVHRQDRQRAVDALRTEPQMVKWIVDEAEVAPYK